MTDNNHPIIPPPKIVREWQIKIEYCGKRADREAVVAKIFQLGADMELEACCEWLSVPCPSYGRELRNARRPKPPSLKEQALQALYRFDDTQGHEGLTPEQIAEDFVLIRRALEQLDD